MKGKVQPESKQEEELEEGLQPSDLEVNVCQGLPLATEGAGIGDICEPHRPYAHAHSSMQEPPMNTPSRPRDQIFEGSSLRAMKLKSSVV